MSALLLTRAEIAGLMRPTDYLGAVETAFLLASRGLAQAPAPMAIHTCGGGAFHAKGAALLGVRRLAALKLNGNFPRNPARGLPTIQGVILLCDAETGAVLAIMDSIEITLRRTAAASALAATFLARAASRTLAGLGGGAQARPQMEALRDVLPLTHALLYDADHERSEALAAKMHAAFACQAVGNPRRATLEADVIVTCTTARAPILDVDDIAPGAFVAAVGADNPEKNELAPRLMAKAKVVADVVEQALVMGDLRHAVSAGAMSAAHVHAELSEVVAGAEPGRENDSEIVVFDSTGTAIQDAASAALVYERALAQGVGAMVELA